MNKVILMGRLTKDAEIRNADSDKKVARCNIAVNRTFKRDGEEQSADFINLVAFKNQADFMERFGKKGVKLLVTGRIQTGSYEKDETRIYTTDVIAEQLEFAESKNTADNNSGTGPDDGGFMNIPDDFGEDMPFK